MSVLNSFIGTVGSLRAGGTIEGDVTISGDLTVEGNGSGNYDEIVDGNLAITATSKFYLDGGGDTYIDEVAGNTIRFATGGTEVMRMTETLNVGIGCTPSTLVEIQGGLTTTGAVLTLSTKEPTVVANDVLGRINFQSPLDTGLDSDLVGASIHALATATFSDTVNSTDLIFSTGASETATEKMRIDSVGNVGIGDTDPSEAKLSISNIASGDYGLLISSTNDTYHSMFIEGNSLTTGSAIKAATSSTGLVSGTGGGLVEIFSTGNTSTNANNLMLMLNDHASSSATTVLRLKQNSTGNSLIIDHNTSGVGASNAVAMHIDYDRTVAGSGTAAHNDIGIDLDVNSASLGTSSVIGMDIDVVGATSGTSTATGLTVDVGSADTNYAALFNGGNVGIGTSTPLGLFSIYKSDGASEMIWEVAGNDAARNWGFRASGSNWGDFQLRQGSSLGGAVDTPRITILNGGNVGIGTTAPLGKLHIESADTGSSAHSGADELVLEGTSDIGMSFLSSTSGAGVINFGDSDDNNIGSIEYQHGTNSMKFSASAGARMILDANSRISLSNNGGAANNTIFGYSAGASIDASSAFNTFIGHQVSDATMTATAGYNTGVGAL